MADHNPGPGAARVRTVRDSRLRGDGFLRPAGRQRPGRQSPRRGRAGNHPGGARAGGDRALPGRRHRRRPDLSGGRAGNADVDVRLRPPGVGHLLRGSATGVPGLPGGRRGDRGPARAGVTVHLPAGPLRRVGRARAARGRPSAHWARLRAPAGAGRTAVPAPPAPGLQRLPDRPRGARPPGRPLPPGRPGDVFRGRVPRLPHVRPDGLSAGRPAGGPPSGGNHLLSPNFVPKCS